MGNQGMKMWRWHILNCALALGIALFTAQAAQYAQTQTAPANPPPPATAPALEPQSAPAPGSASETYPSPAHAPASAVNIFHVKYVSEGAVYLDAGRNAGLEEGMLLHLIHADPNGGTTDAVRFQGQEPIADVRIFSVADSSSRRRNHQIA